MKRENFITQITQIISILSTIAIALSQYFFRDYFKYLFQDEKMYSLASFVSLIVSFVIMIALYSNRYTLQIKYYFNKKKKDNYYRYINLPQDKKELESIVSEPNSFSIKKFSIASIILLPFLIVNILIFYNCTIVVFISYVLFICLSVFSLSTFAIQLYLENDFQNKEEENLKEALDKIKSYFAGEIRIRWIAKDTSNWLATRRILWIERNNKLYKVTVDTSDPDKFFYIEEDNTVLPLNI